MKLTYRPEIDGLRAIAVLAVIFYHAQITFFGHNFFNGGFIGVDIFFVISGYLITSLILKELETTGKFSFIYFYERRARRLLPVLFLVMLASLPVAWMYLLPDAFIDFSKSVLSSLVFSSNIYFLYDGLQYATESALLKPFLHTWSLSVEEQFYITFPFLLFLIFKFFKKYIIFILATGILLSLLFADFNSRAHPSLNFYVLPTRAWELLAGAILANLELKYGRISNKIFRQFFSILGIFLILYSIVTFHDGMPHPSLHTLSPIIGVMLVIWFSNKDEIITKILSSKIFVGTGLISYSLYLWHYPVMAFDRIKDFSPSESDKLQWIILTFILSLVSYFLVEKPFRNKKKISKKTLFISIITIFIFLSASNFYTFKTDGFVSSAADILQKEFKSVEPQNKLRNLQGRICNGIPEIKESCRFNPNGKRKIFFVGDSHFAAIMFDVKQRVVDENYEFLTRTTGGCLYLPNFIRKEVNKNFVSNQCSLKYQNELRDELLSNPNSITIIGSRLPVYLTGTAFDNKEGGIEIHEGFKFEFKHIKDEYDFRKGIQVSIIELLENNNKVILVYPIPAVGWNVPNKLFQDTPKRYIKEIKKNFNENPITTSYKVYKERTKESFEIYNQIQHKNIYRVYPHTVFCNNKIKDRCVTHDDKNIFYYDDDHLSSAGSAMVIDLIMKQIKKIELELNQ